MTIWRESQAYADSIPHPIESLSERISEASFILVLDATYEKVGGKGYYIHIAYDTGVGVIHFAIDESENATSYAIMLNMLAERGYKPMIVVSDGHGGILTAIRDWRIPHQRCIFHFLKNLRSSLTHKRELRKGNGVLFQRMRRILNSRSLEAFAKRVNDLRRIVWCFRSKEQKQALEKFWEGLHEASLHLSFDGKVPSTSNVLERLNGQIEARTKTMRGMKSKKSLFKLLKILFYFRKYK